MDRVESGLDCLGHGCLCGTGIFEPFMAPGHKNHHVQSLGGTTITPTGVKTESAP